MKLQDKEILRKQLKDAQLNAEQAGWILQPDAAAKKQHNTKWEIRAKNSHNSMKQVIKIQNEEALKKRNYEFDEYRRKHGSKAFEERKREYYGKQRN